MKISGYILACMLSAVLSLQVLSAQQFSDRKDVRRGNRDFRKENYKEAEIDYRKALVKDSTSFAANYNLGNALYKMNDFQQAGKAYSALKSSAAGNPGASDLFYNMGNVAVQSRDWQSAVDAYKQALLRNPSDLDAKENYVYARKMLDNQQNQDKNNQNDKDNNQDNKDNKDNQNNQNDRNKDQQDNKDNQDQNSDKGQDNQDSKPQQSESKITPQAAQQMLQAIQAKEKETQEKVKKEKAQALKSRQKEKNW